MSMAPNKEKELTMPFRRLPV